MADNRRVLVRPLTAAEELAVATLAEWYERRMTYRELGMALGVSEKTARRHIENAGAKMPGPLPLKLRVVSWYRGGAPNVAVVETDDLD